MLNKNNLITGVLAALVFPVLSLIAGYLLRYNAEIINRPALPYLIAIALNLLVLRFYLKKDAGETAKGIMISTFAFMLLVFIFKTHLR
jgi:hypothetical protein